MAEETQTSGTPRSSQKQNQAEVKEGRAATRYSPEQLRAEARARFDCSPHMVAGALSAGSKKTYTLDEASDLIKRFKTGKVEG